jgi:hypothetical protein
MYKRGTTDLRGNEFNRVTYGAIQHFYFRAYYQTTSQNQRIFQFYK